MRTFETGVTTADGTMHCYIAHLADNGPCPVVILYMDVPGIRPELHRFAERIATEGYACVLPDLYYREGRVSFDLSKGQAELQRMFSFGAKLTNAMIVSDTRGLLAWLESQPFATRSTGVIGYCMSGQFVVSVAGTFPGRIRAAASLYGVRIVTRQPDSPHLLAGNISAELYLGFAAHDPYVEDFVIPELREALSRHHVEHTIEIHAGTEHGFCFPERPAYHREAAERVWTTVFDLFRRRLR